MALKKDRQTTVWENKVCDICGEAQNIRELSDRTEEAHTRSQIYLMEFTDAVCENCGFVFSRTVPSDEFLYEYYSDSFTVQSDQVEIAPSFDIGHRIDTIQRHIQAGNTIAEVGANTGEFSRHLRQNGYNIEGIDPIDTDSEDVSDDFIGSENESSTWDKKYDAVVSYYVLEHVVNANAWIADIQSALRDNGVVIFEVPNFQQHPKESLNDEHLLHFTPAHLRRLLMKHGFSVLEMNPNSASRYFGMEIVGQYVGERTDQGEITWDVADAIRCYERGREEQRQQQRIYEEIASVLQNIAENHENSTVYFWGANEYATGIVRSLLNARAKIVDNDESKHGVNHPGFDSPIREPKFEKSTDDHRIFVLCSPNWNDEIQEQIKGMGLTDITILDGTSIDD